MSMSSLSKLPILLLVTACVGCSTIDSSRMDTERTSLVVVEVEGRVQMSWSSIEGRSYTIIYSDNANTPVNQWRPLPGYVDIPGTGGQMTATDNIPKGATRHYRLRTAVVD